MKLLSCITQSEHREYNVAALVIQRDRKFVVSWEEQVLADHTAFTALLVLASRILSLS